MVSGQIHFLAIVLICCYMQHVQSQSDHILTYGVDVSFPMHSTRASTNYPWLPHNVSPEKVPTPPIFEDVSVQPLGDRDSFYERYMQGCRDYWENEGWKCDSTERDRIAMNRMQPRSMVNYTDIGYMKMKAPEHVFKMILDFWESNKGNNTDEEWFTGNVFVNYWESPSVIVDIHNQKLKGGGSRLVDEIHESTKGIIQEWTGQNLIPSSLYGIRVYQENAVLSPHVDRNPLINSGIINVAQDVDEPWPLEVIGHDGIAKNVTMEPGDMVLYESHSIIHGRPFPLKGRYFANVFIHFEPDSSMQHEAGVSLPPYVLEGSVEAKKLTHNQELNKVREKAQHNSQHSVHVAARDEDIRFLKKLVKAEEGIINREDSNGWQPIHEAARAGNVEILQYIIQQGGDIYHRTNLGTGQSPLDIAMASLREDHPAVKLLTRHTERFHRRRNLTGNFRRKKKKGWHYIHDAAKRGRVDILESLVRNGININHPTYLGNGPTPLSVAMDYLDEDHPAIEFLITHDAVAISSF